MIRAHETMKSEVLDLIERIQAEFRNNPTRYLDDPEFREAVDNFLDACQKSYISNLENRVRAFKGIIRELLDSGNLGSCENEQPCPCLAHRALLAADLELPWTCDACRTENTYKNGVCSNCGAEGPHD